MAKQTVAIIGLGAMGTPMSQNFLAAGFDVVGYDLYAPAMEKLKTAGGRTAENAAAAATGVDFVVSIVPNDKVLSSVVLDEKTGILQVMKKGAIHISCSTISPDTARILAKHHEDAGSHYVGAPIFARADGVAAKLASFVMGGKSEAVETAIGLLKHTSNGQWHFGEDAGAGNVVKLAGNFLIAGAIESCAEALALAEGQGLDRIEVMSMLNSTIFDCLIYKGYGNRVAARQHIPGQELVGPGFQLTLGLKDLTLVNQTAASVNVPMPVASLLQQRFLSSQARGRGGMDWSAIALAVSEDAGVDVRAALPK
jgi:3-hydroxyisobutyrate dehydrogenase-like beta-hydroxyacid dehydrogenase